MRITLPALVAALILTGCGGETTSRKDNATVDPAIEADIYVDPIYVDDTDSGTESAPIERVSLKNNPTADPPIEADIYVDPIYVDDADSGTESAPIKSLSLKNNPTADPPIEADIYVDPINGDDTASGTGSAPIESLSRAQTLVRTLKAREPTRQTPIIVLLRGGTYALTETLTFGTLDSGTEVAPVVYRAYPGETPVISGGIELSGWTVNGSGHWELTIPEVVTNGWAFTQLWSDGERRYRPRTTKNATEGDTYKHVKTAISRPSFEFYPGDMSPSWTNLSDVEVTIFHKWNVSTMRISSIVDNTVTFSGNMGSQPIGGFTRYIVENVFESLSEPGEWYLDSTTGLLTYIPVSGEDTETTTIVVPMVWRLLSIEGMGTNDKVEYINFEDITFSYNHRATPKYGWPGVSLAEGLLTTSSIHLNYADNIKLRNCKVNHTAGHGITIGNDSHNNTVEGCILSDLGASGIRVGIGAGITNSPEYVTSHNTIQDNLIIAGGRIYPGAAGIVIDNAAYNSVQHNDISDFYYSGIFASRSVGYSPSDSKYNDIGYNRIENIGQRVLSDMGGVYLPGPSEGTRVHHNIINNISRADYGGWGLYNDEGSSGTTLDNNLVYDTRDACYQMNRSENATVSNNIFVASPDSVGVLSRNYHTGAGTLYVDHNIIVLDGRYQMLKGIFGPPEDGNNAFDNNLYYAGGFTPSFGGYPPGYPLATWQGTYSQDVNSIVSDPLFVDPDNNDYSLSGGSPAFALGITAIDLSTTGRISSPKASDIPVAARAYPAKFNSAPIIVDFDGMTTGVVPTVGLSFANAGAIVVTDADGALGSSQSLHFIDSTGTSPVWFTSPSVRRGANTFETGEFHLAFSVKWTSGASLNIQLRDWQKGVSYIEGPSVDIDSSGNVIVDGSTVATINDSVWTRLDITVILGDDAVGTFDLDITPEGSATQSFPALPSNVDFNRLTYIGIHSTAVTSQEFFIDEISAHAK